MTYAVIDFQGLLSFESWRPRNGDLVVIATIQELEKDKKYQMIPESKLVFPKQGPLDFSSEMQARIWVKDEYKSYMTS